MSKKTQVKHIKPALETGKRKRLWWLLLTLSLLLTLVLEFAIPSKDQLEPSNSGTFFYAWFGFFSCVAIILVSKALGYFLKRPQHYYGENE